MELDGSRHGRDAFATPETVGGAGARRPRHHDTGDKMTTRKLAVLAAALIAVAVPAAASASHAEALSQAAVFTLTNSAAGNGIATFARNSDGTLTYAGT